MVLELVVMTERKWVGVYHSLWNVTGNDGMFKRIFHVDWNTCQNAVDAFALHMSMYTVGWELGFTNDTPIKAREIWSYKCSNVSFCLPLFELSCVFVSKKCKFQFILTHEMLEKRYLSSVGTMQ